jgi:hypothetical protein
MTPSWGWTNLVDSLYGFGVSVRRDLRHRHVPAMVLKLVVARMSGHAASAVLDRDDPQPHI